jgi:nuclear pore complex protein Nup85
MSPINRMVAHAIELLTAGSDQAETLLCEERHNLGGISIEELHRLVYAQVLSSHALTWQVSTRDLDILTTLS